MMVFVRLTVRSRFEGDLVAGARIGQASSQSARDVVVEAEHNASALGG
jgi:hypothetical protein